MLRNLETNDYDKNLHVIEKDNILIGIGTLIIEEK